MHNNVKTIDTKTKIIECCKDLFIDKGYNNTTYTDIYRIASIHPGSITYHFKSKKNIAAFLYDGILQSFIKATEDLFPLEDDTQQVILSLGLYQKLLFQDPVFRRFASEYSSQVLHAGPLADRSRASSKSYRVALERIGAKRADFIFTVCRGMDCYLEPYIDERVGELTFDDIFEYSSLLYFHFIPNDELRTRLARASADLKGLEARFDRFEISVAPRPARSGPG